MDTLTDDRARLERIVALVLVAARKERNLSQAELAERLQITRNTIANIESCRRRAVSLVDILMIARALQMQPEVLIWRILRW